MRHDQLIRTPGVGISCWANQIYSGGVTKRLVDIDDELLEQARVAAGAATIRATVDTALRRLVDQQTTLRHIARLRAEGALDVARLEEGRHPRTGTDG